MPLRSSFKKGFAAQLWKCGQQPARYLLLRCLLEQKATSSRSWPSQHSLQAETKKGFSIKSCHFGQTQDSLRNRLSSGRADDPRLQPASGFHFCVCPISLLHSSQQILIPANISNPKLYVSACVSHLCHQIYQ